MSRALPSRELKTTTVRLPRALYDQAKGAIRAEGARVASLNDLIVTALKAYLQMLDRRRIDAAFAGMAEDADYQKEAQLLAEEFVYSDWEALGLEEGN